jgi:hypothetical protein
MPVRLHLWSVLLACLSALACNDDKQPIPVIPLGSCDAASGPSWGGSEVPQCSTDPAPWCGDGCAVTNPVTLVCEGGALAPTTLRVGPDGTPWLLAQDNRESVAPLLVELGAVPTLTPAPKVSIGAALAIDPAGAPHVMYSTQQPNARLRHHALTGTDEDIGCLAGPVPIWVPTALAATGDTLIGLTQWLTDSDIWLAMVRRDGAGEWSIESLPIPGQNAALALADDGTPLIAHFVSGTGRWLPRVQVGDATVDLPFAVGPSLDHDLALVPGADTFLAVALQGPTHVEVALPDQSSAVLPSLPAFAITGCATPVDSCAGTCTLSGKGTTRTPAAVRDDDAIVLVHIEDTVESDAHFEGELCPGSEVGCGCELITDADRSHSDLVLTRVALPALDAKEIARIALPFGRGGRVQVDVAGERKIVVALSGDPSRIQVGTIDLSTLP